MNTEGQKTYNKQYYDANKTRIIQQIIERQKLKRNSDQYIEENRNKLIDALNDGTRKFIQLRTIAKYKMHIDPKTLKYYYNKDNTSYYNKEIYEAFTHTNDEQTPQDEQQDEQQKQERSEQPQQDEQLDEQQKQEQPEQQLDEQTPQDEQQQDEQQKQEQSDNQPKQQLDEQPQQNEQQKEEQSDHIYSQEDSQQDEEQNDNMTIDILRSILEQSEIGKYDKIKILTYPHKKRNKKKSVLIRQIRDCFKF